ncbi:MAG: secretion protein MttC [Lysobacteraceae bacterium]|nr:MAG: secretion protein MttC [Xanthomonadaceae bacterium]
MELFDIGANLTHESFAPDIGSVLAQAKAQGVTTMMVTGACFDSNAQAAQLAERWPGLYSTVGTHPHHAADFDDATAEQIRSMYANDANVKAVGEAGLDYFRGISPRPDQWRCFEQQLEIAAELGAPLFMHCRDAHDDFVAAIRPFRDRIKHMVVHCFTGDKRALYECLDLDLHVGITGWICDERRGHHLLSLVGDVPKGRLMIETDSPYLLPRDIRPKPKSRRNEPKYLAHIAAAIAQARGESVEDLAQHTTDTARDFFQISPAADQLL